MKLFTGWNFWLRRNYGTKKLDLLTKEANDLLAITVASIITARKTK